MKSILIIVATAILTVLAVETVLEKPLGTVKRWLRTALDDGSRRNDFINIGNCVPKDIDSIPEGSAAIIGHAYGRPNGSGTFISPRIEAFIRENAEMLDTVLFTGDVVAVPSAAKWQRLTDLSTETGVAFHIAPGNHDVGTDDNSRRDIWNDTPFRIPEDDLKTVDTGGFVVAFEDSIATGWVMHPEIIAGIAMIEADAPVLLLRHNIAISEMEGVANSREGRAGPVPTLAGLSDLLPAGTTVISGDTGAFANRPRIACAMANDVTFIASGVGDVDGDLVLIAAGGELYTHTLD